MGLCLDENLTYHLCLKVKTRWLWILSFPSCPLSLTTFSYNVLVLYTIPTCKNRKTLLFGKLGPIAQFFLEAVAVQKKIREWLPGEGAQWEHFGPITIPHNGKAIMGQGASPPAGQPLCTHWDSWLSVTTSCQQVDFIAHGLIPSSQ